MKHLTKKQRKNRRNVGEDFNKRKKRQRWLEELDSIRREVGHYGKNRKKRR